MYSSLPNSRIKYCLSKTPSGTQFCGRHFRYVGNGLKGKYKDLLKTRSPNFSVVYFPTSCPCQPFHLIPDLSMCVNGRYTWPRQPWLGVACRAPGSFSPSMQDVGGWGAGLQLDGVPFREQECLASEKAAVKGSLWHPAHG